MEDNNNNESHIYEISDNVSETHRLLSTHGDWLGFNFLFHSFSSGFYFKTPREEKLKYLLQNFSTLKGHNSIPAR